MKSVSTEKPFNSSNAECFPDNDFIEQIHTYMCSCLGLLLSVISELLEQD